MYSIATEFEANVVKNAVGPSAPPIMAILAASLELKVDPMAYLINKIIRNS